ncbi:palmitoyl-[glycerolipid] 7-desaturase [Ranunculus cassubicifolius]
MAVTKTIPPSNPLSFENQDKDELEQVKKKATWVRKWALRDLIYAVSISTVHVLCLLLSLITFGESWHNNHDAFDYSARQGLEWWQIDLTWYVIMLLEYLGLATDVKLPSEAHKQRLSISAKEAFELNRVGRRVR